MTSRHPADGHVVGGDASDDEELERRWSSGERTSKATFGASTVVAYDDRSVPSTSFNSLRGAALFSPPLNTTDD